MYYIGGSARGQYEAKPAVWLATRVEKMDPSCPFGINHFDYVQHKNFLETQRAAEESQDEENIHDSQGFMYCAKKHSWLSFPALEISHPRFLTKLYLSDTYLIVY